MLHPGRAGKAVESSIRFDEGAAGMSSQTGRFWICPQCHKHSLHRKYRRALVFGAGIALCMLAWGVAVSFKLMKP
jgi:hypothetical protein